MKIIEQMYLRLKVEFSDYNPDELMKIFEGLCKKESYDISEYVKKVLRITCHRIKL